MNHVKAQRPAIPGQPARQPPDADAECAGRAHDDEPESEGDARDMPLEAAAVTDQSSASATHASTYASHPRLRYRCPRSAGVPTNAAKDMAGIRCLHGERSAVQQNTPSVAVHRRDDTVRRLDRAILVAVPTSSRLVDRRVLRG